MRNLVLTVLLFSILFKANTQAINATRTENTTDKIAPELVWYNVLHYDIAIKPDYENKFISGANTMRFRTLDTGSRLQVSLQQPMQIREVHWHKQLLTFERKGNRYTIQFPVQLAKGKLDSITIRFEGNPVVAKRPPFESGWIFTTDKKGRPWMSIACEGSGASIWMPCKETGYDEPDNGMTMHITVPDTLVAVANGRLTGNKKNADATHTYTWSVVNTINNYNIIPCIGKYVTWHRNYPGAKGNLDCDFWVLDYNADKAKKHLAATDTMLRCFEYWLGPYPFYEDSYKLVESPMPGMEHQSAIAYGNGFANSYNGYDMSGSGWGMKWDFILVHESGHEWFGNSITAGNDGESWIHEGFTKYLETLYTDYVFGHAAGNEYATGNSKRIKNDANVIGSGTTDAYYKGSAMLHITRQLTGDPVFRSLLRGLNKTFYHQTVTSQQVEAYINAATGQQFATTFDQYLRSTKVPVFEYKWEGDKFSYRWTNCVPGFNMPLKLSFGKGDAKRLVPVEKWQSELVTGEKSVVIDPNFYIKTVEVPR